MLTKIGKRIKATRLSRGITQEQLAEKVNLSLTSISRLENGKAMVSIEKLFNIATALNTDLAILLCDYITSSADSNTEATELLVKFKQLNPEKQKSVLAFVDIMYGESLQ